MVIEISAKNIPLTSQTKDVIAKKFILLAKFLSSPAASRLHIRFVRSTGEHHKKGNIFAIDARLYTRHNVLKANDTGESVLALCDKAKEQLERQLLKQRQMKKATTRQTRKGIRKLRGKQ